MTALAVTLPLHAQTRLPDGTLYYWDCDNWASGGWRDEEWNTGGSGRITFDANSRQYGTASIRLDGLAGKQVAALSLERPTLVEESKEYVLQLWARTRGVNGVAEVRCLAHGPQGTEMYRPLGWVALSNEGHLKLPADSEWTRYHIPLKGFPGGTNRVFFYFRIEGEGTVWFDEMSVAEAGVEVPLGAMVSLRDEDYAGVRFDDGRLPENLLTNPGFEEGMASWELRPAEYTAGVDDTVARTGRRSFRFDAKEFTGCHIIQRVRLDPRRYYRLSVWAKCSNLVGYFYAHLLPFNKHGTPIGWHGANHSSEFFYVTGTTDGWEERVLITKFAPDNDSLVIFPRVDDAIGTVWIDDLCIKPLPLDYTPGGEAR